MLASQEYTSDSELLVVADIMLELSKEVIAPNQTPPLYTQSTEYAHAYVAGCLVLRASRCNCSCFEECTGGKGMR